MTQLLFCFTVELCKQGSSLYACSVQSWTSGTGNFLLTFHPRASAPCHYTQHILFHLSPRTSKGRRLHFCNVKGEQFQFPCLFLLQKARYNFTGSKYFHGRMTVEMLLLKRELYTNQLTVLQCLRFNGIFPFTSQSKWTFLLSYSIPVKTSVPRHPLPYMPLYVPRVSMSGTVCDSLDGRCRASVSTVSSDDWASAKNHLHARSHNLWDSGVSHISSLPFESLNCLAIISVIALNCREISLSIL